MTRGRTIGGEADDTGVMPGAGASRAAAASRPAPSRVLRSASVLAGWSLLYAAYRAYYALGGQVGMIGRPVSRSQFEQVNAAGAGIIVVCAVVVPLTLAWVPRLRRLLVVVGWLGAVGCCMHALVDATLRLFSLTGVHPVELPPSFWASVDRQKADLQDLLLNEPWFFAAGLLWAGLALTVVPQGLRHRWVVSAVVVCLLLSGYGVLRGLDVLGPTLLG